MFEGILVSLNGYISKMHLYTTRNSNKLLFTFSVQILTDEKYNTVKFINSHEHSIFKSSYRRSSGCVKSKCFPSRVSVACVFVLCVVRRGDSCVRGSSQQYLCACVRFCRGVCRVLGARGGNHTGFIEFTNVHVAFVLRAVLEFGFARFAFAFRIIAFFGFGLGRGFVGLFFIFVLLGLSFFGMSPFHPSILEPNFYLKDGKHISVRFNVRINIYFTLIYHL